MISESYTFIAFEDFTVECDTHDVTAYWELDNFRTSTIETSLNDKSCNSHEQNLTHAWVHTNFTSCGSLVKETKTHIYQQNTVLLHVVEIKNGSRYLSLE